MLVAKGDVGVAPLEEPMVPKIADRPGMPAANAFAKQDKKIAGRALRITNNAAPRPLLVTP